MEIKKIDKSYIPQILDLESESAPGSPVYIKYDKKGLEELFSNPEKAGVFGAFDGDKLVGWASYRSGFGLEKSSDGEYAMSSMVVNKDYRRKGVGTLLFNERI